MTWGTDRLAALKAGSADLPSVVKTLKLGGLDDWGPGWVIKRWHPVSGVMHPDGSMFGGYIAALADQALALATLSVIPDDRAFRTAQLAVQFLKLSHNKALDIKAMVINQSTQVISVEATFTEKDGTLIAKATAQQITTRFSDQTPGTKK